MRGIVEGGERGLMVVTERQDDCWDDFLLGLVVGIVWRVLS